jgi:hypothetical protein
MRERLRVWDEERRSRTKDIIWHYCRLMKIETGVIDILSGVCVGWGRGGGEGVRASAPQRVDKGEGTSGMGVFKS